jgi:hypothetical protein
MYQYGSGHSERRQVLNESTASRFYENLNGVRINIVQVHRSSCAAGRFFLFASVLWRLTLCADRNNFDPGCCDCNSAACHRNRAARCGRPGDNIFCAPTCFISSPHVENRSSAFSLNPFCPPFRREASQSPPRLRRTAALLSLAVVLIENLFCAFIASA